MYSKEEEEFLFNHFNKTQKVLEYGSGESSIDIAKKVNYLVTMEFNFLWYKRIEKLLPKNAEINYIPSNHPYFTDWDKTNMPADIATQKVGEPQIQQSCYANFKNYIEFPLTHKPFDIIFIDGSARVACTSICKQLGHKDTLIFIHDWEEQRFPGALKYLKHIETIFTMAKFKIKN